MPLLTPDQYTIIPIGELGSKEFYNDKPDRRSAYPKPPEEVVDIRLSPVARELAGENNYQALVEWLITQGVDSAVLFTARRVTITTGSPTLSVLDFNHSAHLNIWHQLQDSFGPTVTIRVETNQITGKPGSSVWGMEDDRLRPVLVGSREELEKVLSSAEVPG